MGSWSGNTPKTPKWYGGQFEFGPIVETTYLVIEGAVVRGGKCVSGVIVKKTTDPLLAYRLTAEKKRRVKCLEDMTVLAYSNGAVDG